MFLAKYKNELYKAVIKSDTMEIIFRGKKDGFQQRKSKNGLISYKQVEKNELEGLYTAKYYVIWDGERYEFDFMEKNKKINLWMFSMSDEFAEKKGFAMIARGEYVKEVRLEECEYFIMLLENYYSEEKEERVFTRTEFLTLYKQF